MFFPPHRHQPHRHPHQEKRQHLKNPPPPDGFAPPPQDQPHRRRQRAGRRLAEQGEGVEQQRQPVKAPPRRRRFLRKFRPRQKRQQIKQGGLHILQFRDPGHTFHLHRMQRSEERRQPCPRHRQPRRSTH